MDQSVRSLRFDQLEILNEVSEAIESGLRRLVVQAPTGAGKTVVSSELLRSYLDQGKRVLFVVPAISLVNQSVEVFQSQGLDDVGVMQAYHEMTDWRMPLQVASVQTLSRRTLPKADLVIIDEIHHFFKFYEKWLLDPAWKDVPFIGLSATPWTKGLGAWFQKLIIASTTQELIDDGILSPFQVFAPAHPDLRNVRTLGGDYREDDLERTMDQRHLVADIVETWLKLAISEDRIGGYRPTFCFCVNRSHAKHVQEQFLASGVACGYQDAYTKDTERRLLKAAFHSGEVKVVCSVGTMIVGIDWDVRCIIMARPTKSEILFVQSIGRGLRTAPGKDYLVILDHSSNHSDRFGYVTDVHHDELDNGTKRVSLNTDPIRLPKECPQCHYLKPPKTLECPSCGFKTKPVVDVVVEKGELVPLVKRKKGQTDLFEEPETYSGLLWWANYKGYAKGWAYHKFIELFNHPPNGLKVTPSPPSMALSKRIRAMQIRWAKSRHNPINSSTT
jgi:DNA repair protein RadD